MNQRIMGLVREQLTVYVDGLDLPSTVTFTVASYTQPSWVAAVIANDLAAFRAELHQALAGSGYQADE